MSKGYSGGGHGPGVAGIFGLDGGNVIGDLSRNLLQLIEFFLQGEARILLLLEFLLERLDLGELGQARTRLAQGALPGLNSHGA